MIKLDPKLKPPYNICPKGFCFFWVEEGNSYSHGLHDNINEALREATEQVEGCSCSFGTCRRVSSKKVDNDWYEPNDLELEKNGLPWFYFLPYEKLSPRTRKKYIRHFWGGRRIKRNYSST